MNFIKKFFKNIISTNHKTRINKAEKPLNLKEFPAPDRKAVQPEASEYKSDLAALVAETKMDDLYNEVVDKINAIPNTTVVSRVDSDTEDSLPGGSDLESQINEKLFDNPPKKTQNKTKSSVAKKTPSKKTPAKKVPPKSK